jgi:hypothetical protein
MALLTFFQAASSSGGSVTSTPSNEIDYHILMGQSNMAGRMLSSELINELSYLSGQITLSGNNAYIINKAINDTEYQVLESGVNTSDSVGLLGIQSELAYRMLEYKQADVRFIQCAFGGTTIDLYRFGSVNFTWAQEQVVAAKTAAKTLGKTARFKSVIWIQGESNGGDNSGIYEAELRGLIDECRIYFQEPELLFVIGQMIDCQTGVNNLSLLQDTQALVAIDINNDLLAKGDGPQTCRDPLHWSTEKYIDAANDAFELIKDL